MRSLTAGIPNGRSLPPSLGISTRLIGSGRYSPVLSARSSSSRYASARTSNRLTLCPSTPAAPALPLTLSQATLRVWLRYTLSIRLNHFPPLTPFSSAANMRSLHTVASTHVQSRPWAFAPCLALAGTPGASLALCLGISLTLLPPCLPSLNAAFLSAPLAAYHRSGTMKALTPPPLTYRSRSPRLPRHIFLSFRLQPRGLPGHRFSHHASVPSDFSDFALESQARRSSPPNRVRSPTDQQFASGCSPHCLTTTQLPSATELWHTPTRTFTVLMWRPHGRTIPDRSIRE